MLNTTSTLCLRSLARSGAARQRFARSRTASTRSPSSSFPDELGVAVAVAEGEASEGLAARRSNGASSSTRLPSS